MGTDTVCWTGRMSQLNLDIADAKKKNQHVCCFCPHDFMHLNTLKGGRSDEYSVHQNTVTSFCLFFCLTSKHVILFSKATATHTRQLRVYNPTLVALAIPPIQVFA